MSFSRVCKLSVWGPNRGPSVLHDVTWHVDFGGGEGAFHPLLSILENFPYYVDLLYLMFLDQSFWTTRPSATSQLSISWWSMRPHPYLASSWTTPFSLDRVCVCAPTYMYMYVSLCHPPNPLSLSLFLVSLPPSLPSSSLPPSLPLFPSNNQSKQTLAEVSFLPT